jgi:broad specificity phosphatase PhoE
MWKLLIILLALAAPGRAADLAALAQPGTHLIVRHALAPGTGDPDGFTLRDCATQRNLDARGRKQAAALGATLRAAGARFDAVLSSQWCRCLETARLMALGPVTEEPALNSFFGDRARGPAQTRALREVLLAAEGPLLLVTHQVNITALTGRGVRSGEAFVIRIAPNGAVTVLESVLVDP